MPLSVRGKGGGWGTIGHSGVLIVVGTVREQLERNCIRQPDIQAFLMTVTSRLESGGHMQLPIHHEVRTPVLRQ